MLWRIGEMRVGGSCSMRQVDYAESAVCGYLYIIEATNKGLSLRLLQAFLSRSKHAVKSWLVFFCEG